MTIALALSSKSQHNAPAQGEGPRGPLGFWSKLQDIVHGIHMALAQSLFDGIQVMIPRLEMSFGGRM